MIFIIIDFDTIKHSNSSSFMFRSVVLLNGEPLICSLDIVPLPLHSFSAPVDNKHLQIMMPPPPCFLVGMVCSTWSAILLFHFYLTQITLHAEKRFFFSFQVCCIPYMATCQQYFFCFINGGFMECMTISHVVINHHGVLWLNYLKTSFLFLPLSSSAELLAGLLRRISIKWNWSLCF